MGISSAMPSALARRCDVMAAGEGIETMLSLRCALPAMPMAAALSANHLAALLLPPALRRLYIARDADAAGDMALAALTERAEAAGIEALALSSAAGRLQRGPAPLRPRRAAGGAARPARAAGWMLHSQMIERLPRNITSITAPGAEAWASTSTEAQVCLKKSSFPEPPRNIEQRRSSSNGNDISFISRRPAQGDRPCGNAPTIN